MLWSLVVIRERYDQRPQGGKGVNPRPPAAAYRSARRFRTFVFEFTSLQDGPGIARSHDSSNEVDHVVGPPRPSPSQPAQRARARALVSRRRYPRTGQSHAHCPKVGPEMSAARVHLVTLAQTVRSIVEAVRTMRLRVAERASSDHFVGRAPRWGRPKVGKASSSQ